MAMKKSSWILIILLVAVAAFFSGRLSNKGGGQPAQSTAETGAASTAEVPANQQYTCGMHPMIITDEPGTCPICGMDLTPLKPAQGGSSSVASGERKIKYWVAPMDPTYIRDEPGKSPMGMDLVPVYEDEAPSGSIISIDPVTAQNMGVRTALVERRDVQRTIRTVGLIDYEEPSQAEVTTKIAGWIERLYIDETGQHVKKGQPLLDIYSPELVSAQEEYLLALDNQSALAKSSIDGVATGADRLLEAAQRRLKLWDISDRQIDRLKKNRQVSKTLTLYAQNPGIVTMKMVSEGAYVKPGMKLFEIADITKVWVMADIYEYELPWVKVGQDARVILPFADNKEVMAKISYLYPYVEPKTRTVKARLELANPDFELKPDMYVNVRVQTNPVHDALAIPSEAILRSGEEQRVFVALGDGKFEPRTVKTGVEGDDGYIVIKGGLLPGDKVVTSAQFMFDSESKLREAIQKMTEPKESIPAATDKASGDSDLKGLFSDDTSKEKADKDLDSLFK